MQPKKAAQAPLDLSKWRNLPFILMGGGGLLALIGVLVNPTEFAYAWLVGFMFCLSLCVGAWFLVMAHHLFDAGWSVPIRRFNEHIANLLFPWVFFLFIPVAIFRDKLYDWFDVPKPALDHALISKFPLFTPAGWFVASIFCFLVFWLIPNRLRYWSLQQDKDGASRPTYRMRFYASIGIVLFAISVTLGVVMWMKGMQYQWFSTMYAVYYFAGSVWMTLGTVYVITMILDRKKVISHLMHDHQYYYIGSLMFAFTVFYAYIHLAQYFIIWNGNMPEETFWYLTREKGIWWYAGLAIIFLHFFVPFLALIRIDVKSCFKWMTSIAVLMWVMHYIDLTFNIMPVLHKESYPLKYVWLPPGCWAFMVGLLMWRFLKSYAAHPPYPLKDPRAIEAMGHAHPVPTQISGGEVSQEEEHHELPPQFEGTNT